MVIKILPNEKGAPTGKLADAEVHFTEGALDGLRLLGFAVWERRNGPGRNVTFPARTYSVNGERRSFSLLRPVGDANVAERDSGSGAPGVRGIRVAGGGRQLTGAAAPLCRVARSCRAAPGQLRTGSSRAFSLARLGGSVHSARVLFSNSARKNGSFMPPSMMLHGSTASLERSR